MELTRLSAARLQAEIAKRDARETAATDALIAAGRGHERANETRAKSKEGDALAVEWAAARDAAMDAYSERSDRRRYHGSDNPIRRRA